jgi:hypothetical protein
MDKSLAHRRVVPQLLPSHGCLPVHLFWAAAEPTPPLELTLSFPRTQ